MITKEEWDALGYHDIIFEVIILEDIIDVKQTRTFCRRTEEDKPECFMNRDDALQYAFEARLLRLCDDN